jgi:SAM-dependent methyltransferase
MNLNQPLSIDSDSFDTVLLLDVLEHIARPVELLAEVSRILRAGGKVIVGVPFFYWLHEQPYDFYRFTEFALVEMCKSSGLDVISLAPYGGVPEILVDVSGKCLAAANQNLGRAYVSTCALALALRPVRSLSRRTSKLFPYGYILVARKGTTAGIVPSGGGSPDENRVI